MNYNSIILMGLLLPAFGYSTSSSTHCEYLGKTSCLKSVELHKLAEQIRTTCHALWIDYHLNCKNDLYHAIEKILQKEEMIDIQLTEKHLMDYSSEVEIHLYKGYPNYYVLREKKQDTTEINAYEEHIKKTIHTLEDAMITLCNDLISTLYIQGSLDDDLIILPNNRLDTFKYYAIHLAHEIYALAPIVGRYQSGLNEVCAIAKELIPFILHQSPDLEDVGINAAKEIRAGFREAIAVLAAAAVVIFWF